MIRERVEELLATHHPGSLLDGGYYPVEIHGSTSYETLSYPGSPSAAQRFAELFAPDEVLFVMTLGDPPLATCLAPGVVVDIERHRVPRNADFDAPMTFVEHELAEVRAKDVVPRALLPPPDPARWPGSFVFAPRTGLVLTRDTLYAPRTRV